MPHSSISVLCFILSTDKHIKWLKRETRNPRINVFYHVICRFQFQMLIKEISSFKTKSPNTLASCFLGCGHLMAIYKVPNYYRVLNYRPGFIISTYWRRVLFGIA